MRDPIISYRLQLGTCAGVLSALAVAQLVIVLLHHWPSSVLLWVLYFEFARRLDSVFRFARGLLGIGPIDFVALAAFAMAAGMLAVRARIRLLEALVFHGAFFCAVLILLDNLKLRRDTGLSTADIELTPGLLSIVALFALCALPLAAACLRVHANYIELVFKRSR